MPETIQNLRTILYASIDSTPEKVSSYFKIGKGGYAENDKFLGIKVPTLRKIAKRFILLSLEELAILITSTFNEERLLALIILTKQYPRETPEKQEALYKFYRSNMRHVNNWNLVDSSAHLIIGAHLFKRDRNLFVDLASSPNLWERRIAIVAT